MINQTLNNRYHIIAQLGKGAMGEVYRATDTQTGQDVAIKVITQDLAFDREMLERFRREGEALRQLRHPNIVGFVDMFQSGSHQAIVMEYVPGGNLHALLKQGPLPLERVKQITLDLCDALTRAHRLEIVHRDLKPENVLIAEDGTPKLTDFGVARLIGETSRLTGTGALVGTPFYMAPEAWQGQPLDAQADIWSLGVMLFEMLAGQVPFSGDTMPAVMNQVLTGPVPDLKTLRPDTPSALVQVIQRMLTRDKAKRYQTVRQLAADLEGVGREGEKDQEAAQPATTGPTDKVRRALPGWAVAALAVVALLVVGGFGLWTINGQQLVPTPSRVASHPVVYDTPTNEPSSSALATATLTPMLLESTPVAVATPIPATQTSASMAPASNIVLGQVLLQTDFEDGKLTGFSHLAGLWKIVSEESGNHVLDHDNLNGTGWDRILFGDMTWKNYVIEYRVRLDINPSFTNYTNTGIEFRYENIDRTAGVYDATMHVGWTLSMAYTDFSKNRHFYLMNGSSFNVLKNHWYKIRLEVNDDSYKYYIDGTEKLEATDSTSLFGPAGFAVGPGLHVQYDDLRVTKILPTLTNTPAPSATETPSPQSTVDITPVSAFIPGAQVTYQTKFDDMIDWGAGGSTDFANGLLTLDGKDAGAGRTIPLSKGYGTLFLFRCTPGTSANIVLFNAVSNGDKEIGIQTTGDFAVSLNYGGAWHGGQRLNGTLRFVADRWYYALIEIKNGGQFYLKVWPQDDLASYGEKTLPMGTQWDNSSWYGTVNVNLDNTGRIEVASYQEFRISGP